MSVWITSDGETADLVVHRAFGATAGLTEALLEANPGLADRGPVLPAGLALTLPAPIPAPTSRPLRLWD